LLCFIQTLDGERIQMSGPTVTASVVYDDPRRGIAWLTEVLALKLQSMFEDPNGGVAFAELVWRNGMVFVSGRPPAHNPWSKVGVASIALVAEDADSVTNHYTRVVAAGADIVRELHVAQTPAFPEGSTQFDVRDPEGNLWTVGTFQPTIDPAHE
jgi:uncharacterized glyoxalase superfamily protein PhnB